MYMEYGPILLEFIRLHFSTFDSRSLQRKERSQTPTTWRTNVVTAILIGQYRPYQLSLANDAASLLTVLR